MDHTEGAACQRLAEMAPLVHYPRIDDGMAMAFDDVYGHARISRSDLFAEAGRGDGGSSRERGT